MSESNNPYAAPTAAAREGATDGPLYVFEGGLFVVDADKKIPGVCLKCGSADDIDRREERLAISSGSAAAGGAFGGVMGAVLTNALRHDRELVLPMLGGFAVLVAIIAFVVHLRTERVNVRLPLCAPCNRAWTEGVRMRTGLLVGLGAIGVGMVFGLVANDTSILAICGGAFGLLILVAIGMKLPKRFVVARKKVGSRIYLFNVGSNVPSAIERRLARQAAKRAAKRVSEQAELPEPAQAS